MPPVRILQAVAGADFSWAPGDVVPMSDEQAEQWVDGVRAELVTEPVDGAVFDAELDKVVRKSLSEAEEARKDELEWHRAEAVRLVDDNSADPDNEQSAHLRELVVELVAGVAPSRAVELALLIAVGETIGLEGIVAAATVQDDGTPSDPTTEEVSTVDAPQTTPASAAAEQRDAKPKPETTARQSRRGSGRAEPKPETRG